MAATKLPGVKIVEWSLPNCKHFGATLVTLISHLNHALRMARRNKHSRTGTWWKSHCETGAVHIGCYVGPFLGRHNYKGPPVF